MRTEEAIFDDLSTLCASPGYVHALAFLSFRDNIVAYSGEMTANDVQHLFSPNRLIRIEIATLIGLLLKQEISYVMPTPETTEGYIDRTEALLEEMHNVIGAQMFEALDAQSATDRGRTVFDRGAVWREPIIYSGESAYTFQYRELSPKKYGLDDDWLKLHKGFSIHNARDVAHAIMKLQTTKLQNLVQDFSRTAPSDWTILRAFSFDIDELSQTSQMDKSIVHNVVSAFTATPDDNNETFCCLQDFNVATATPIIRAPNDISSYSRSMASSKRYTSRPFIG